MIDEASTDGKITELKPGDRADKAAELMLTVGEAHTGAFSYAGAECDCGWHAPDGVDEMAALKRHQVEAVLAALADAGLLVAERDDRAELAAELERVKAERDRLIGSLSYQAHLDFVEKVAELLPAGPEDAEDDDLPLETAVLRKLERMRAQVAAMRSELDALEHELMGALDLNDYEHWSDLVGVARALRIDAYRASQKGAIHRPQLSSGVSDSATAPASDELPADGTGSSS